MSLKIFRGDAPPIAQVTDYLFGGTWEANDKIKVTCNNKTPVTMAAGSTTISAIIDALVTAIGNVDATVYPEFSEFTASRSGSNLRLTSTKAGVPFEVTLLTTESDGSAADGQTIDGATSSTGTDTIPSSGPNHYDDVANWVGGVLPVDGDDVLIDTIVDILYGLDQTDITPASFRQMNNRGKIGLPRWNPVGYWEYRTLSLTYDGVTDMVLGDGDGPGSTRVKIALGAVNSSILVLGSGASVDGVPAVLLSGGTSASTCRVARGDVGIAFYDDETATLSLLGVAYLQSPDADAKVHAGPGLTLTTFDQTGGFCKLRKGVMTTLRRNGGELWLPAGAITNVYNDDGKVYLEGSANATWATYNGGSDGLLSTERYQGTLTITNTNFYERTGFKNPANRVTFTNPFKTVRCSLRDIPDVDFGPDRSYQVS